MKAPSALSHSAMSKVDGMQSWSAPSVPTLPGRGPALRLYDSADRQVRPVTPGRTATMYVCGITPYDATHLGHAATYLTFDLVNRLWLDAGHDVHYVQNITDVDDPLFERAHRDGVDWQALAHRETDLFREDMAAMRVLPPRDYIAATESIAEVRMTVELIFQLLRLNPNLHVSPLYNFTPYPGTELFDTAVEMGMAAPTRLEDWARFRHEQTNLFPERRDFYESLYFTSLFVDHKTRDYDVPWAVRMLADLYRPVARFRTRPLFFRGLVERRAMDVALALWKGVGQNMAAKKPLAAA